MLVFFFIKSSSSAEARNLPSVDRSILSVYQLNVFLDQVFVDNIFHNY
jgi:hypothetical protein